VWHNILGMDEKDALDRLGPPDEIVGREHRMPSRTRVCSTCRQVAASPTPILVPAQRSRCGGIAFETVRSA
jgi:hypothetical protein